MKDKEFNIAPVRMEREKYRAVRHAALDLDLTFNAFMNKLIDEHLAGLRKTESTKRGRASSATGAAQ